MIELKNLHVTFGQGTPLENPVLQGLDLHIEGHEFVTVIGSNGSGKSTLLNAISGEVKPHKGQVRIDGHGVHQLCPEKRALYVARVFQNPLVGTCAQMSIEENLAFAYRRGEPRSLGRAIRPELRQYFKEVVSELKLGLESRLQDPIGLLSGGQRQAVSLLMATLKAPKILLLDEHTAALDPKMARVVMELTEERIQKHRLTTLMVTHSMHQALEHGTRTVLIHQGRVARVLVGEERAGLKPHQLMELFEIEP